MADTGYIPALRFRALTALYDPFIRFTTREAEFKRRLLEEAELKPAQRVLDLACGTGTLAIMAKQVQPAAEVVGLDGDPEILRRDLTLPAKQQTAREISRVLKPGERLRVADWGKPRDLLMAVLFFGVRLLDGFEQTRDNVAGNLPRVFADSGLIGVEEGSGLRTIFGSLSFYRAETRGLIRCGGS